VITLHVSCGDKKTVETKEAQTPALATELSKNYAVDTVASTLGWTGKKVTGRHNGKISISNGTISVEKNEIKAGSFIINMNTITIDDIKDVKENSKFLGHLKSPDFFDVAKFTTSTFEVTSTEKMQTADSVKISGNLTIKDISKNISIPAKILMDSTKFEAAAKFSIDRTEWNIRYGSGKFFKNIGDKAINDAIEFDLNLKATPTTN
jgi:polyisoprenoid-binding protein YceI